VVEFGKKKYKEERRKLLIDYQEVVEKVIQGLDKAMGGEHYLTLHSCLSQEQRRRLRKNPTPANIKLLDSYLNSKLRVNWFTKALGFAEIGIILLSDTSSSLEKQHVLLIKKVIAARQNGGTNEKLVLEVEVFLEIVKNRLLKKLQNG